MVKSKVTLDTKQVKIDFISDLSLLAKNYVESIIIPQIERDIKKLFDRTTAHWDGGRVGSQSTREFYPQPSADFTPAEIEIDVKGEALSIHYKVGFDAKAGGKISKLWYILDFGRPDGTWNESYASAWFLPQSSVRTEPNSLDVQSTRSYIHSNLDDGWIGGSGRAKVEDGLVYIRKFPGDDWGGIDARNWSKLIAEEIQKIYQRQGLKVTFTRKNPVK